MGLFGKLFGKGKADGASGATAEDPVCHMQIHSSKAAGTSTHGVMTYHFCSTSCKAKFDQDPHKYLGAHAH